MNATSKLDDIALGYSNPTEAREALRDVLQALSAESAQSVYTALRAWVWKALNARRRDPELREWFDILERTSSFLAGEYKQHAERLQVLTELIYESISVSEVLPTRELLKRRHVREVLTMLHNTNSGKVTREQIRKHLGLKQANLTRILNLMLSSGLIERLFYGKQAIFKLTQAGVAAVPASRGSVPDGSSQRSNKGQLSKYARKRYVSGIAHVDVCSIYPRPILEQRKPITAAEDSTSRDSLSELATLVRNISRRESKPLEQMRLSYSKAGDRKQEAAFGRPFRGGTMPQLRPGFVYFETDENIKLIQSCIPVLEGIHAD